MYAHADRTAADRGAGVVNRCGDHICPPSGCEPEELHRKASRAGLGPAVPASVRQTLTTPGRPLDPSVRQAAEGWSAADLSSVRVHSDEAAARSARDIDAQAYTVGEHIVFGAGRYEPGSQQGRRTLAHELTHVLQQRAAGVAVRQTLQLSHPDDPDERRAEAVADAVARAWDNTAEYAGPVPRDGDSPAGGPILPVPAGAPVPDGEELVGWLQRQADPHRVRRPVPRTPRRASIQSIEIDLEQQAMFLHWSDRRPVQEAQISSGRGRPHTPGDPCADQNSANCTPTGIFHPTFRSDASYRNAAGAAMSWYVDLGVRGARGNDRGIGIHDSQQVTGHPASHGCIRVVEAIARTINENVTTDTSVHIRGKAPTVAHGTHHRPAAASPSTH
jgi:hypothetical protein